MNHASKLFFAPITPQGNGFGGPAFSQISYDNYEGLAPEGQSQPNANNPATGAAADGTTPDLTQQGGQGTPPQQPGQQPQQPGQQPGQQPQQSAPPVNQDGTQPPATPPVQQNGAPATPGTPPTTNPANPATAGATGAPAATEAELDAMQAAAELALAPLIEAGIYRPEENKPYDLTTDAGMIELARDTARANFRDVVLEIPEAQREFVIAAINGATREQLRALALVDATLPDYSVYDLTKPEHVSAILTAKATTELGEGATTDEIRDLVATYEALPDTAKKRMAETGKTQLIADGQRQRQAITQQAAAAQLAEQQAEQLRQTTEITSIRNMQYIGKLPVGPQDKEALIAFMYNRDAEGKTAYDRSQSMENRIAQAFFTMKGFDLSKTAGRPAAGILSTIARTGGRTGLATNSPTAAAANQQMAAAEQNLQALEDATDNYRPLNLK